MLVAFDIDKLPEEQDFVKEVRRMAGDGEEEDVEDEEDGREDDVNGEEVEAESGHPNIG
jgi:hypothetical protein